MDIGKMLRADYEKKVASVVKTFQAAVDDLDGLNAKIDAEKAKLAVKKADIVAREDDLDTTASKIGTMKERFGWLLGEDDVSTDTVG